MVAINTGEEDFGTSQVRHTRISTAMKFTVAEALGNVLEDAREASCENGFRVSISTSGCVPGQSTSILDLVVLRNVGFSAELIEALPDILERASLAFLVLPQDVDIRVRVEVEGEDNFQTSYTLAVGTF